MTAPATEAPARKGSTVINLALDRPVVRPTVAVNITGPMSFLQSEHEVHAWWHDWWKWLERAMKGGIHMQSQLRRFDWELSDGESIHQRRRTATYINYPDLYATALAGFLTRSAPTPQYGSLGEITGIETPLSAQTRADLFHFNVDTTGNQGSEWNAWWAERMRWAMAFGFTWIMEEAPVRGGVVTLRDQQRGIRPYLIEWRPRQVWDWHFEDGALQYAIIRYHVRKPRQDGDTFNGGKQLRFYLHTRKGWDGFGDHFKGGGFWVFNDKGELVKNSSGTDVTGNYDSLDGEIPLHPLYFQRDTGDDEVPAIARPAIIELAAMAESYMNLSSAADFEVWDAAKGMEYLIGVSQDAFNLASEKIAEGSRFIPILTTPTAPNPRIQDSNMSVVPSASFGERLSSKREDAAAYTAIQQNAGPDASGRAREADFASAKAPLLALFSSEIQSAQNLAIYNIQRRWGFANPGGGIIWPRKFELIRVAEAVADVFDAAVSVGVKSATLFSEGVTLIAKDTGFITDEAKLRTIGQEIKDSLKAAEEADARARELAGRARGGGGATGSGSGSGGATTALQTEVAANATNNNA